MRAGVHSKREHRYGMTDWPDSFYQYRVPIDLYAETSGWNQIPLDEWQITEAINTGEQFKYDADVFAYEYLKVWDEGISVEGGFCMIPEGDPLLVPLPEPTSDTPAAMYEDIAGELTPPDPGDVAHLTVEPHRYHLLRYVAQDGGSSPAVDYEPVFPIGCPPRCHGFRISYEPRLLPCTRTEHQVLLLPDTDTVSLRLRGRGITKIESLALQKVEILLLAHLQRSGHNRLHLYYQPMCSHYLTVPDRWHDCQPLAKAKVSRISSAQKYLGATRYRVASDKQLDVWFADTTVKLTPDTPAPESWSQAVFVSSARNERQSFQLVLWPRIPFSFKQITVTALSLGDYMLPASQIDFRRLDYVPIRKSSEITPARYRGWIGDPLVPVVAARISPETGNHAFWVTIDVAADVVAGVYEGQIRVERAGADYLAVPIQLEVHDFALPEHSPFEADMGGFHIHKSIDGGAVDSDYHGVHKKQDLQRLANAYFEEMARNKFTPKNAALYTEIGMRWDPPPEGYNIDKPENFFRLYDWDFTRFNLQLDHFINKLKVNQVTIYHTNPQISNVFVHLPGRDREQFQRTPIRHTLAMGWQTFRETTYVAYGKIDEKHPVYGQPVIEISRSQYDHLVLGFFRAIARNMDDHGWLDYATIMVDEMPNEPQLLHFLKLLKSDPLTAKIKVGACLQCVDYLYYREQVSEDRFAFNGLLDFYMPELCENYNRWDDCFFEDYSIPRQRRKVIPYVITTSRSAIDAPGINNRLIGLDVFRRGGGGYLIWDTFVWDHPYGDRDRAHGVMGNPWMDPYTRHANGALSFFYPPRKDGYAAEPDFTITPSVRVMNFRKAVDDFEYAYILEKLIDTAQGQDLDVSEAAAVLADISRFFHNSVHWSQNDAWYLELRHRIAKQIVRLQARLR